MDNYFGLKVAEFLERYEGRLKNKKKALDIGTANGSNARYLANLGLEVEGIDIELPDNMEPHKNIRWIKSDILNYDFQSKYDVIIAFNVLQFLTISQRNMILDKMEEALNPEGMIFIKSFTQKDPSFGHSSKIMGQFAENELLHWAEGKNLHILEYQEKEIEDNHLPLGKHTHGIVYFAADKS